MANKTGRNDPCPCGSGKKYKRCHAVQDLLTGDIARIKAAWKLSSGEHLDVQDDTKPLPAEPRLVMMVIGFEPTIGLMTRGQKIRCHLSRHVG